MKSYLQLLLLGTAITSASAFLPAQTSAKTPGSLSTGLLRDEKHEGSLVSVTALYSDKKKKGGLDESMRNKLLTESIAPWRTIRLFLYGAFGSGAFIGGLVNGSGAIAAMASPEFNMQTELLNIGIDFGFVILMGVCAKFDLDKQSELQGKVDEKVQRKKEMKVISKAMKERENILQSLPLEITVGADGSTRTAKVGDLQRGANQHMIIVAGPRKACKDALIGANLMKMDFAMSNVLVVPYQTDIDSAEELARPSGGFGDRPSYETQPYIARPTSEEWDEYIVQEINDAVEQSGENVKTDGIALVVANNGSIIRRGVGTVPWRQMVQQLEETVNPSEDKGPLSWLE